MNLPSLFRIARPVCATASAGLLLTLLSACAVNPPAPSSVAPATPALVEPNATLTPIEAKKQAAIEAREQAQYQIMLGEMAAGRHDPETAAHEFLGALSYYKDAELASRTTSLALTANDADLAEAAADRWLEIDPSAIDAREILARLALRRGSVADTLTQCQAIASANADGPGKGVLYVAHLLGQANNAEAVTALAVMDKLVAQYPQLADAQQAMGLLALHFGKPQLAEAAARDAMRLEPKNQDYAFLLVGALVKQNRFDDADQQMARLLGHSTQAADLHMGYARLLLESGQSERARAQLQLLLKKKPDDPDAHYALGVMALNDKQFDEAERQFKPLLKGRRGLDAAYQMGLVEEARKNFPAALSYYETVTRGNSAIDAAVHRAYILAQIGRVDEAQGIMQDLRAQVPPLAQRFYLTEGDLLTNANQGARALAVYNEALDQYPDDADLLYGRSLVYERSGQVELAEKDLRTIIAANADDARALNALGYMLTEHSKRYDEARKLIARALVLDPDDGAIMDSMGWVQYQLGEDAAALKQLQQAYDKFPDPEVAAHLGEVMWQLGDKQDARAVWDKALKQAPDQPALLETIKRLDKK
ncbi:MAG: tetratricopeptide repeat protein [Stenotrophobium sp.]